MDINKLAGDVVYRWRQKQGTDKQLKRAIVRAVRLALRKHQNEWLKYREEAKHGDPS